MLIRQQPRPGDSLRQGFRVSWMRSLLLLVLIAPLTAITPINSSGVHAAVVPTFSPIIQAQLRQAVIQALAGSSGSGAVIGIWLPGHGTWVRAVGRASLTTKQPTQVQDATRIGSITKTFIGTLILQLAGERKLTLDTPIAKWVPLAPNAAHITIRELLNHTSGIFDYAYDASWQQQAIGLRFLGQWSPPQLVRVSAAHRPYFSPGSGYHYSNTNYILLGMILEKITGQKVEDLVQSRILQPLGLHHTFFPTGEDLPNPHMEGYSTLLGHIPLTDVTRQNTSYWWTAGAMVSDLGDLHTWVQALATGKLLSPKLQKERLTWSPQSLTLLPDGQWGYGLGISLVGGFLGHSGDVLGFSVAAYYLPSAQATIVAIMNADDGHTLPAQTLFLQLVTIVRDANGSQ